MVKLAFFVLVFSLASCQSNQKDSLKNIKEKVEQDRLDGVKDAPTLKISAVDLPSKKYIADKDHSSISFRTKHWEIVDIIGWFADFEIIMHSDKADFTDAVIAARVYPRSVWMPNPKMAGSAQQFPYLDATNYPEMRFESEEMKRVTENTYELLGQIQLNGIKKEIVFDVVFNGFAYPGEQSICGFDVNGQINRNDFNIGGADRLHSNKLVHADSIYIQMALRME